jgi:2',3'-cyclic-nucleotide 2'-phosphodiesterase (5'-nucleotidase family)
MNNRLLRRFRLTLGSVLFAGLLAVEAATGRLLILHTNDLHDHVRPGYGGVGGLPYVAGYVAQVRAERRDVLLLDAGDVTEKGDLCAFKTRSVMTYEMLRRMEYDALTLGNHDHDQGLDWLRRYEATLGQQFVCLNRVGPGGEALFPASRLVERGGIKIAIIGLMVPQDEGTLGLEESGRRLAVEAERLDREAHLVIALVHHGTKAATQWARQAPAVDIFVTGHTHEVLRTPLVQPDSGAVIVQAGWNARFVGRLEIEVDLATGKVVRHEGSLVEMKHAAVAPDPALVAWVRERERAVSPEAGEFVLNNAATVGFEMAWLAAEALRRQAGTDLAFCHPGHIIRNPLPPGPVDVNALFRTGGQRGHSVVRASLTGAEIEAYLNSLGGPPSDQTAWAGMVVTEESASGGRTVLSTNLDPAKPYSVVMPELEWSKRFLRAAGRQKSGPLAGRRFAATPVAATYTDALWRFLRGRSEAPQLLLEEAREIARRAFRRAAVTAR